MAAGNKGSATKQPIGSIEQGVGGPSLDITDRFNYMADLLLELRHMAAAEGCTTLTGLLDLSQSEARSMAFKRQK